MKLPRTAKQHNGNKFWPLEGNLIECTYSQDFEIVDFWINRVKVEQDEIIMELADKFDTPETEHEIMDFEKTEAAHKEFLTDHSGRL